MLLVSLVGLLYLGNQADGKDICTQWITPFWDDLVLKENRPADFDDLKRLFVFMDTNGDDRVSREEFLVAWRESTMMSSKDSQVLFIDWSVLRDATDPENIVDPNVHGVWTLMDNDAKGHITQAEFEAWWRKELEGLPDAGCP